MRRKSQHKNAHSIELCPETTARACSSLFLMNCHKNLGWTEGEWHFILLSFPLRGGEGGKKPWEGIRHYEQQHQNLKAQSSPSVAIWMERGSRKESWFSERNCSGAWKCLFFNCVSVGIYRLTLSWCKSALPLHCNWFMAPEDLAPYFLLWACLPKTNFFTTSLLLVNETTGWKQQTMLSRTLRWIVLWKMPSLRGKAVAFWANFAIPGAAHPERDLLSRAWIWCLLCQQHEAPMDWCDLDIPEGCEM